MKNVNRQFRAQFIAEADEHLATVESVLLAMESDPRAAGDFGEILRALHSLKGISGVMLSLLETDSGQPSHYLNGFHQISHLSESLLQRIRDDPAQAQTFTPLLFTGLDQLKGMLNAYRAQDPKSWDSQAVIEEMQALLTASLPLTAARQSPPRHTTVHDDIIQQNLILLQTGLEQLEDGDQLIKAGQTLGRGIRALRNVSGKVNYPWLNSFLLDWEDCLSAGAETEHRLDGAALKTRIEAILSDKIPARSVQAAVLSVHQTQAESDPGREADGSLRTVRLAQDKIDDFMNLIGELKIQSNALQGLRNEMELANAAQPYAERFNAIVEAVAALSQDLHDRIMSVRLLPLSLVFSRFPRLVRDLGKKLSREVRLQMSGEETVIDKNIIDALYDPLVHMVRNAVDHGIEPPQEREELAKPRSGTIEIKAYNQGQKVVIEVADDGRGLNAGQIRRKAAEKGLADADFLQRMTDRQLYEILFTPGFSLADKVSEISGRGVGLDVVRTNIERIGGVIEIDSQTGLGTRFCIQLPLTLAIGKGLLVESRGQNFYLPIDLIEETMPYDPERLYTYKGQEAIVVREALLRVFRLDRLLGQEERPSADGEAAAAVIPARCRLLLLETNRRRLALLVDGCDQEAEYLVKPLPELAGEGVGFSGAMITAAGSVVLVLDIPALLSRFEKREIHASGLSDQQ